GGTSQWSFWEALIYCGVLPWPEGGGPSCLGAVDRWRDGAYGAYGVVASDGSYGLDGVYWVVPGGGLVEHGRRYRGNHRCRRRRVCRGFRWRGPLGRTRAFFRCSFGRGWWGRRRAGSRLRAL